MIAGFSPWARGCLSPPYPIDPQTVRMLSWPDLEEISLLEVSDVDASYGFGLAGWWINDDRAAVCATEYALIVTDANAVDDYLLVVSGSGGSSGRRLRGRPLSGPTRSCALGGGNIGESRACPEAVRLTSGGPLPSTGW